MESYCILRVFPSVWFICILRCPSSVWAIESSSKHHQLLCSTLFLISKLKSTSAFPVTLFKKTRVWSSNQPGSRSAKSIWLHSLVNVQRNFMVWKEKLLNDIGIEHLALASLFFLFPKQSFSSPYNLWSEDKWSLIAMGLHGQSGVYPSKACPPRLATETQNGISIVH